MTNQHWTPPSSSGWLQPYPPDLSMLMGRVLERSEATIVRLDRIDSRLEIGDARMDTLSSQLGAMEKTPAKLGGWEKALKAPLPYIVGLGTLAATGSIDAALKVLAALR